MVFESLVSNLLNRVLGDYVVNLDSKQLDIGFLGGRDIILNNLEIRPTVLDDFDLPVKLRSGHLSQLTLKIPFKNLWTQPVVAVVDGLYILVVPNRGIKYSKEKEEKYQFDAKQKELLRIEEARKAKKKAKETTSPEQQDGFVEKWVTQVIKNVQVTVSNIHIRFEDEYTNRARPFAAGVTLYNLTFQTTNENWVRSLADETVKFIHKIVELDSLSIYWNSDTTMMSRLKTNDEIRSALKADIASKNFAPGNYTYILRPISVTAKLRLNQKPERDGTNWTTPKHWLALTVADISMNIGKFQFQDIMEFMEGLGRMSLSAKFSKFRPDLKEYRGHSKEWWHFAHNCVMSDIQQRKRNWDWNHMKEHRRLVKRYSKAYLEKCTNKKASKEDLDLVERAEKELDVFNLNIARQQADFEIEKKGLKRVEEQGGWGNYISSWWGGGGSGAEKSETKDIASQFGDEMTDEEKKRLYEAIDYNENAPATLYPIEFIETEAMFELSKLEILVNDDLATKDRLRVLSVVLDSVSAQFEQRPADRGAMKLSAKMGNFVVEGLPDRNGICPMIAGLAPPTYVGSRPPVTTPTHAGKSILSLQFETNPLNRSCDQRVKLDTEPLNVVYHAASINRLLEVLRKPESVQLKEFTTAMFAKYEEVKSRSTMGLEFALQNRTVLKLDVNLAPVLLIVPEMGCYTPTANLLILDLGVFKIRTKGVGKRKADEEESKAKTEAERRKEQMDKAYDKFQIELKSLQILFSGPKDNWVEARSTPATGLHVLEPTGFNLLLERCTIEDLNLARAKVFGNLPDLDLSISDRRLLDILKLLMTIPTPPAAPTPKTSIVIIEEPTAKERAKLKTIMEDNEVELNAEETEEVKAKPAAEKQVQINLEVALMLEKISVKIFQSTANGATVPVVQMILSRIGTEVIQTTFDMKVEAVLDNFEVLHGQFRSWSDPERPLMLVENPNRSAPGKPFVQLKFIQADRQGPFFFSEHNMTEMLLKAIVNPIHLNLHQEAIVSLQKIGNDFNAELTALKKSLAPPPVTTETSVEVNNVAELPGGLRTPRRSLSMSSVKSLKLGGQKKKKKSKGEEMSFIDKIINTRVEAHIEDIQVSIGTNHSLLTVMNAKNISADLIMREKEMIFTNLLRTISIIDPTPGRIHRQILSVSKNVFDLQFRQFIRTDDERKVMSATDVDMAVEIKIAQVKFVFLNIWLTSLLDWLGPFQAVAQDAASQAGAAAAANTLESVKNLHAQATKMKFDIDISAPVVWIPQNSLSKELLLADFGNLAIQNKFTPISAPDISTTDAIVDEMTVKLTDMKVSRMIVGEDLVTNLAECQILEPVTFDLALARNLSFDWYKQRPEISISAMLPVIKASLSQEDYAMIMATLAENLGETAPAKPGVKPTPTAAVESPAADEEAQPETTAVVVKPQESVELPSGPHGRVVRMIFNFKLKLISAGLYMGSSNLTSGLSVRDPKRSLARVEMQSTSVDGKMTVDGSMMARVILVSFTMDDARLGHEAGISRLLDKKLRALPAGETNSLENMIDVDYSQDSLQNQKVDIKLTPFFLCFNAEFLAALGVFFAPPGKGVDEDELRPATRAKRKAKAEAKLKKEKVVVPPKRVGSFVMTASLGEPEIILVEDAMKPAETKALVLKFDVKFKMQAYPDSSVIQGELTNLQLMSTFFQSQRRKEYEVSVLKSCDVFANVSQPYGEGQNVDIRVTPVVVKVSPSIIQLLSCVASSFSSQAAATKEEMEEKRKTVRRPRIWDEKSVADGDFWFLDDTEEGVDAVKALTDTPTTEEDEGVYLCEELQMTMEAFVLTLETGFGNKTVPLIFLDSKFHAEVRDWSSHLSATANLQMEMAYYNERLSTWEAVIEPVEKDGKYLTWEVAFLVQTFTEADRLDFEDIVPPPKMKISILSTDVMQLTVTKSFLDVTKKLGEVFTSAAKQTLVAQHHDAIDYGDVPFLLRNDSGLEFQVLGIGDLLTPSKTTTMVPPGATVGLNYKVATQRYAKATSASTLTADEQATLMLELHIPEFTTPRSVNLNRADKRLFHLPHVSHPGDQWSFVTEVRSDLGQKTVILRSHIQVVNHLSMNVDVYHLMEDNLKSSGQVPCDGGVLNLPLAAIFNPAGELFFKPTGGEWENKYGVSSEPIKWRSFGSNLLSSNVVRCKPVGSHQPGNQDVEFFIQVCGELDHANFENTHRKNLNSECYKIHLRPAVTFHNVLPLVVSVEPPGIPACDLAGGETRSLYTVCPGENEFAVKLKDTAQVEWAANVSLAKQQETLVPQSFSSITQTGTLDLLLHCHSIQGSFEVSLFSPFWMLNKTGMKLSYKHEDDIEEQSNVVSHPADYDKPLLFTFSGKNMFKKKKVCLRVGDSEWSDSFPLDVAGSSGRVTCKTPDGSELNVTVNIQLSNSGLSKIVTILPFYILENRCRTNIQVKEADGPGRVWFDLPVKQNPVDYDDFEDGTCTPYWPVQVGKRLTMTARYADTVEETTTFPFSETFETLLTINSERVGMFVHCNVSENSVIVSFEDFSDGMAAVVLINDTDNVTIEYSQKEVANPHQLMPNTFVLYNWENQLVERELKWSCGVSREKKDVFNALFKDDVGKFETASGDWVFWVSFLNGRQRTLLFSKNESKTLSAQGAYELERVDMEYAMELAGMGVSIVNNFICSEIAYVSITSSGVVWEMKRSRWKPFSVAECRELEVAYKKYEDNLRTAEPGTATKSRMVVGKLDVDFVELKLYKPSERLIRRIFQTGLSVKYQTSPHTIRLQARLNKFQIDNQLPACVFHTMFSPTPMSKSVAADSIPKPFIEVSYIQRVTEHSSLPQVTYFQVLVQEMAVKVDQGFINAILALFAAEADGTVATGSDLYEKDMKTAEMELADLALQTGSSEQKKYYDHIHFSPLKIHLSFSQGGSSGDPSNKCNMIQSEFVNMFMKSVGVTLTEIQDVVFKLAYYESKSALLSQSQLMSGVISHYTKQGIKQFYVLVLGLDVIGNPFGLMRNLGEGVQDLFYEPFQGAIQGPEEFAEGLALGVKSLFGHTVGGAAGAVSRITGTFGKGLAALTFDDEYQRKRQAQLNRKPKNFSEGMARSTKGLFVGIYDGVTGVVMKPVEGAKQDGAAGFFKGVGKGLVGFVARPVGGVVDCASGTLEAVKTLTDVSEEVVRVRPPRYLESDGIVRPYNRAKAEGNNILQETDKGKYASTDAYFWHGPTTRDRKGVLLLTDKRVLLLKKSDIFGNYDCEWEIVWQELAEPPSLNPQGQLLFHLQNGKKTLFGARKMVKAISIEDLSVREFLAAKSVEAYNRVNL